MIRETLLTTRDAGGTVHVAPMGVEELDGQILVRPFRPSRTLDNIQARGQAVVNYCTDVRLFAGCVTGRQDWPLEPAVVVRIPRLQAALATTEVRLTRMQGDPVRPKLWCRPVYEGVHRPFRGLNRAQAAVLEAAVLVSRLDRLPAQKVESELAYLTVAIDKTAGPAEREAWEWLMERVDAWRQTALPVAT